MEHLPGHQVALKVSPSSFLFGRLSLPQSLLLILSSSLFFSYCTLNLLPSIFINNLLIYLPFYLSYFYLPLLVTPFNTLKYLSFLFICMSDFYLSFLSTIPLFLILSSLLYYLTPLPFFSISLLLSANLLQSTHLLSVYLLLTFYLSLLTAPIFTLLIISPSFLLVSNFILSSLSYSYLIIFLLIFQYLSIILSRLLYFTLSFFYLPLSPPLFSIQFSS